MSMGLLPHPVHAREGFINALNLYSKMFPIIHVVQWGDYMLTALGIVRDMSNSKGECPPIRVSEGDFFVGLWTRGLVDLFRAGKKEHDVLFMPGLQTSMERVCAYFASLSLSTVDLLETYDAITYAYMTSNPHVITFESSRDRRGHQGIRFGSGVAAIAGKTQVGKTYFALELARQLGTPVFMIPDGEPNEFSTTNPQATLFRMDLALHKAMGSGGPVVLLHDSKTLDFVREGAMGDSLTKNGVGRRTFLQRQTSFQAGYTALSIMLERPAILFEILNTLDAQESDIHAYNCMTAATSILVGVTADESTGRVASRTTNFYSRIETNHRVFDNMRLGKASF